MNNSLSLRQSVGYALGIAGVAAARTALSAAGDAGPAPAPAASDLQEVVVTGSHIRRIDTETASAVVVIDQKQIEASGLTTVGDLIQRLPSISGNATNPNVNNGGGGGASTVSLRGLGSARTLVLVDGRRQGINLGNGATDVNQIPLNLIDHIEVLKEGAGAIYGSDAIGGVVNFITRSNVEGVELTGDYGKTSRNDGSEHSLGVIFGGHTDTLHFEAGAEYHSQKAVYAGARDFSKYALYLYGGTYGSYKSGSSRTPTGRISIPKGTPLRTQFGCSSVTRIGPLNGPGGTDGTSLADYRCFNGSFTNGDRYNYQPYNLLTTPIERTQAFTKFDVDINDHVTAYANFTFSHTHSNAEEAALPFDSPVDDVVISKNNIYNPFGIDFGGLTTGNPAALWRLTGLADRKLVYDTNTGVANAGVRGKLPVSDWEFDLNVGYSRLDQTNYNDGYFVKSLLQQAVGPSFLDPANNNAPTCGTPTSPIPNCKPLNIFDIFAPGQQAILQSTATNVVDITTYTYKSFAADFNGTLAQLPAGPLKAAVGFDYSDQSIDYQPSELALAAPPLYLQCAVSNEQCSGPTAGGYNAKEISLELDVPLAKDLPGVHSLNLNAGVRYSDYSLFGSTTKSEFKVEYKPISDLQVSATWAQVFRVPTLNDLFSAPTNTSVTYNDPCNGLTSAKLAANPNLAKACSSVIPDSGFAEPNGQITGLQTGNPNLKPETGRVETFRVVYDPSYVPGLSFDIDYWKYNLANLITTLDSNYAIGQCVATGNPFFCGLRTPLTSGAQQGQILVFQEPTYNLSSLMTDGVDFGVHYVKRTDRFGVFNIAVDVTDTMSYLNVPAPGADPQQIAGTYNKQFGNYARFRGLAVLGWSGAGFDGMLSARYIGKEQLIGPAASGITSTGAPYPPLDIPAFTYFDGSIAYNFPTKTKLQLTAFNILDKQPPILYQNNVTNANTDVNTYDLLGRRWMVSFTQKF